MIRMSRNPEIIHVGSNFSLDQELVPWVEKNRIPENLFRFATCLQCGAYDDRYCGCWQDRAPGYSFGSGTSVRRVDFTVLSPIIYRRTPLQSHATPILSNPDVSATTPVRHVGKIGGTGVSPVLARARSAHTVYEGGGWD